MKKLLFALTALFVSWNGALAQSDELINKLGLEPGILIVRFKKANPGRTERDSKSYRVKWSLNAYSEKNLDYVPVLTKGGDKAVLLEEQGSDIWYPAKFLPVIDRVIDAKPGRSLSDLTLGFCAYYGESKTKVGCHQMAASDFSDLMRGDALEKSFSFSLDSGESFGFVIDVVPTRRRF